MSTAQDTIGKLIDEGAQRDAVHIALAPAVAGENLRPGQHVGLNQTGQAVDDNYIGIVDPYFSGPVMKGQRFWLFLYPNTVTGMRHEWQHPAFAADTTPLGDKAASEKWLRDFVARADCPSYERLIAEAVDPSESWDDDYLHFNGSDAHGEIPPEFWNHVEVVTGQRITHRPGHFSCSC